MTLRNIAMTSCAAFALLAGASALAQNAAAPARAGAAPAPNAGAPARAGAAPGRAGAAPAGPVVDINGNPCDGVRDRTGQCIPAATAQNSVDRPYRDAGTAFTSRPPTNGFSRRQGRELLYVAVPGGYSDVEGSETSSGEGIIVLDVANDYRVVGRIPVQNTPKWAVPENVSGMMASPATNMVYVSTRGHLYAIDLQTEKMVWSNGWEPGTCCERGQVTPDGLTLEVGSNLKNFHRVIDAKTGTVKGIIDTPMSMSNHNMAMSPDGKTVFNAPNGLTMTVASMETMKAIKTITFSDHIRVFVINHDATKVYANLNNLLGFEIADVATGKVVKRVEAPAEMWKAKWADPNQMFYGHGSPQHGIGFTPDESELWITDAINNQILVYDMVGDKETLNMSKTIKTAHPASWITMGLDGKRAYLSSGDVVDVKTHKIIAQLKDEYGNLLYSEKVLDMLFDNTGKLLRTVNQFAAGDPAAVAARIAAEKPK